MRILGENIEKLKATEDSYISQSMNKNTAGFFNYHANDLDIAKHIGKMNADGSINTTLITDYKKPLENLAMSRYKHEFCLAVIANFDEYMKMVDVGNDLTDREKEGVKTALITYAEKLNDYNDMSGEKLRKELGIGTDKDVDERGLQENEDKIDGHIVDKVVSAEEENRRISEEMSIEELNRENNEIQNPLGTEEQTLDSIIGSVADFIYNVYKYIANSISSIWNRPQQEEVYENDSLEFPDESRNRTSEL